MFCIFKTIFSLRSTWVRVIKLSRSIGYGTASAGGLVTSDRHVSAHEINVSFEAPGQLPRFHDPTHARNDGMFGGINLLPRV